MDTNINFTDPNMAMFLNEGELGFYNLVYGGGSAATHVTNMLLIKTASGQLVPPSYPTNVELQTPIDSLDYDGNYFWSLQAETNDVTFPGWVIRKWSISEDVYTFNCLQTQTSVGYGARALAVEWYQFPLYEGTDATQNTITVDTSYYYIIERLDLGFNVQVGPNGQGSIFTGTVKAIYPSPNSYAPQWWTIEFEENLNTTYVKGENVFFDARVHIFTTNPAGQLLVLNPVTLQPMETHMGMAYGGVNACAFSIIENVPSINVGMLTPALFYVQHMVIYCKRVIDLSAIPVSAQIIPTNADATGESFFAVYELRVRNDDFSSPTNHPQHYLLQNAYRDGGRDGAIGRWPTYNYILQKLEAVPASLVVDVEPQFLTLSGIAYCTGRILDDYSFPIEGAQVIWSHNCGSNATFLDNTTAVTDANGYVHNRLFITKDLTFPAYITATTNLL